MPDILYDFPIQAGRAAAFETVTTPAGLDRWWTLSSSGVARTGAQYRLFFGAGFEWRATVSRCVPNEEFELLMGRSDADWQGTRVGFRFSEAAGGLTLVAFHHLGWPEVNSHYRVSAFCWAMYLRVLRRWLEDGESVPYAGRLSV